MKYANSTAFRRALEDRLRGQSLKSRLPLLRLRKLVAFDRLLARLVSDPAESWILKGGLALQLRLGARSRTTQDMDLLWQASDTDIHQALMRATGLDLGDWFAYEITRPPVALAQTDGGVRFHVQAVLDGRPFERFHLDVGVNDPVLAIPNLNDLWGRAGIWRLIYKVAAQFCGFSMARVGEANRRLCQIWNC